MTPAHSSQYIWTTRATLKSYQENPAHTRLQRDFVWTLKRRLPSAVMVTTPSDLSLTSCCVSRDCPSVLSLCHYRCYLQWTFCSVAPMTPHLTCTAQLDHEAQLTWQFGKSLPSNSTGDFLCVPVTLPSFTPVWTP